MFGDEAITREILGGIPAWMVGLFYVGAGIACSYAAWCFWRRSRSRQAAAHRGQTAATGWPTGLGRLIRYLVFHEQLRRDPFAGWSHLLVVYGFLILFAGTCLVFLEHDTPLHFFYGWFYQAASVVIDLGGLAFVVGLGMFLTRRLGGGKSRVLREWWVTSVSLLLLAIGISGFFLEASRIAVDLPAHEWCSVVGYPLALGLRVIGLSGEPAMRFQQFQWGLHAALCVAFFALLPWGFFSHIAYAAASVAVREPRILAALPTAVWTATQTERVEFTPGDLLQADACTTCGRCNSVCPAAAAGKPLRPRDVVLDARRVGTNEQAQFGLADDVLWSCTTCGACNHACPVGIDVYDKVVAFRREKVEQGIVPNRAETVFSGIAERGNPFDRPSAERLNWALGIDVPVAREGETFDTLYWVGCSGAFSPEGRSVAVAMTKILKHLGEDFRVLGTAERCTGDPARRMGEEGLFRECAAHNLGMLAGHGVKRVITHCPHCFNTMRNEYPDVADVEGRTRPAFSVIHHSEYLATAAAEGKLSGFAAVSESVTFHDPCYLARGNSVVEPPRALLSSLNLPIVEMPRAGKDSFCCGAGGGSLWLDVRGADRIENQRYAEATATGAAIVATGCPFCKTMLGTARSAVGSSDTRPPRVMDLAELVAQAEGLQ